MRLPFKSKKDKDKDTTTSRPDTPAGDDGNGVAEPIQAEPAQQQQQQQQQQPFTKQTKIRSGMPTVMTRQAKPLSTSDMVQESIGRFCGLSEDWSIVLELSDSLRTSTAACKLAAEALRKEFKHGSPMAQERAAKLVVILSRNTSDRFKLQIVDAKFLKTLKATIDSQKTDPKVKAMLFKAVGTIVWENQGDRDLEPLMQLYQDIRPPNAPKDGIPVEDGDPTFEPGVDFGQHYRTGRRHRTGRAGGAPFDPALQLDQLKHRAMVARSEAGMLNEALAFTAPDELEKNAIIQEFYKKALAWQQFIADQLPWVQAEAGKEQASGYEELLDLLLSANGEVHDALSQYHDIEQRNLRQKREEAELLAVTERSKQEKSRLDEPLIASNGNGAGAYGNYNLTSSELQPVASASGSSNASGSGSGSHHNARGQYNEDTATAGDAGTVSASNNRIILQTNNPYASRSEPTNVLPDRYIIDEPDEVAPLANDAEHSMQLDPTQVARSVPTSNNVIGDKNPFGHFMRPKPAREGSEDIPVPQEPSAKALGKLRRMSGQPVEAEEQQRRLEEQLRQKYQENFQAERKQAV